MHKQWWVLLTMLVLLLLLFRYHEKVVIAYYKKKTSSYCTYPAERDSFPYESGISQHTRIQHRERPLGSQRNILIGEIRPYFENQHQWCCTVDSSFLLFRSLREVVSVRGPWERAVPDQWIFLRVWHAFLQVVSCLFVYNSILQEENFRESTSESDLA